MNKTKRVLAVILSIVIFLTISLMLLFGVYHMNHECSGEHCEVCEHIQICNRIIKKLGGSIAFAFHCLFAYRMTLAASTKTTHRMVCHTLINLKVQLTC